MSRLPPKNKLTVKKKRLQNHRIQLDQPERVRNVKADLQLRDPVLRNVKADRFAPLPSGISGSTSSGNLDSSSTRHKKKKIIEYEYYDDDYDYYDDFYIPDRPRRRQYGGGGNNHSFRVIRSGHFDPCYSVNRGIF